MIQTIPDYNKFMYLQGYKSEDILSALRQKARDEQNADSEPDTYTIKTIVEVKK